MGAAKGVAMGDAIEVQRDGDVVTWTLNRPENRNVISEPDVIEAFEAARPAATDTVDETAGEVAAEAEPSKPTSVTKTPVTDASEPPATGGLTAAPEVGEPPPASKESP